MEPYREIGTMTTRNAMTTASPIPAGDLERDRRLEVLLDELVATPREEGLPADFAARVVAARPFAPWEVSRSAHWKVPAGVGLGLLAGSLGLALTPLWSLGPATALTVWTELLAAALGRPVATLLAAFPLLSDGAARTAEAVSPAAVALVGASAVGVAATLGLALGRLRRAVPSAGRTRA
jgi:hypothetical protein